MSESNKIDKVTVNGVDYPTESLNAEAKKTCCVI